MNFTKCLYHPNTGKTLLTITSLLSIGGILASVDMVSATEKNSSVLFKNASTEIMNFIHSHPRPEGLSYGHILGLTIVTLSLCLFIYSIYQLKKKCLDAEETTYQPPPGESKKQSQPFLGKEVDTHQDFLDYGVHPIEKNWQEQVLLSGQELVKNYNENKLKIDTSTEVLLESESYSPTP